jgi:hypothetical protein
MSLSLSVFYFLLYLSMKTVFLECYVPCVLLPPEIVNECRIVECHRHGRAIVIIIQFYLS